MKDRGSRQKWHFTNVSANDIVSIDVKTLVLLKYDLAIHLIDIQYRLCSYEGDDK